MQHVQYYLKAIGDDPRRPRSDTFLVRVFFIFYICIYLCVRLLMSLHHTRTQLEEDERELPPPSSSSSTATTAPAPAPAGQQLFEHRMKFSLLGIGAFLFFF